MLRPPHRSPGTPPNNIAIPRTGRVHQRQPLLSVPTCPAGKWASRRRIWLRSTGPLPQGGILRHEGLPLAPHRLEQTLLRLKAESQPVQPVTTAAAQTDPEPLQDELPDSLSNTSWPDARLSGRLPYRPFHRRGGTTGLLKYQGLGPPSPKTAKPTVHGVGVPLQACGRELSSRVPVGARIIRRRGTPICHCSPVHISLTPITNPRSPEIRLTQFPPQIYPYVVCAISPWLWFRISLTRSTRSITLPIFCTDIGSETMS